MKNDLAQGEKSLTERLRELPDSLTGLQRGDRLGEVSRTVGFDPADANEALRKVYEELREVEEAILSGDREAIEEEFGDLFLSATCACRLAGADSEESVRKACEKYVARMELVEMQCLQDGRNLQDADREDLLFYWRNAKKMQKCDKNGQNAPNI